jgi:hypothetical protein
MLMQRVVPVTKKQWFSTGVIAYWKTLGRLETFLVITTRVDQGSQGSIQQCSG